ncbi:V-type proton ATPase subunit F [Camellia lanceoleosa]|uniref:V-type proton ATPase subunit F n=1 Tax=Camellia lanceoleosa TaxID=1840588 RepID=A0ACC0FTE0_9ERIC|nr:V-type proton ATPase subunit F [Camellia lanceoleosa]
MHQTQARQVHKELQDTLAQLEAIRHEIRTVSFMNPGPLTRRLVDNLDQTSAASGNNEPEKPDTANRSTTSDAKNYSSTNSGFSDMHSQATAYAKLAESTAINSGELEWMKPVANMIRFLVDSYNKPVPAILEIPSKDHPYDHTHDSVLSRVKYLFSAESVASGRR